MEKNGNQPTDGKNKYINIWAERCYSRFFIK